MPTMPITLSDTSYSDIKFKESALASAGAVTATIKNKNSEIINNTTGQMQNHYHQVQQASVQQRHRSSDEDTNRQASSPPSTAARHPASTAATGQTTVPQKRSANDFRFGKSIGEGSFSTVYLAEDIHTRKEYAIKVCDKQHIIKERKHEYIKREREVLNMLSSCPGFVNLYCTFQDTRNLYFVMTYAKNGDMLPYIRKVGSFDLDCTRFYAAELVLAMEHMHRKGVIHRDLKPENILLDEKMHALIADFGSAKVVAHGEHGLCNADPIVDRTALQQPEEEINMPRRRRNSFVGTAQYVSPEILNGKPTSRSTDLWALGCIVYQMISGLPPFRAATEYLIFQKVLKAEMSFPEGFDESAADLVEKLIQLEPSQRLGSQDKGDTYDSIRNHPFFEDINWDALRQQTPPPIYPYLPGLEADEKQREQYRIPDFVKPGFDEKQLNRLIGMEIGTSESISYQSAQIQAPTEPKSILDINETEKKRRLEEQQKSNVWHTFADSELILKQGFINKRKGLFARKRMLLLTTGPRLIYIDSQQMIKKGEIPWTSDLRVEPKNFKVFFVHTPNRTYYLEDPEHHTALEWCKAIDDVRKYTYERKN